MGTTKTGRSGRKGECSSLTEMLGASCIYKTYNQHEKLHWRLADWPNKKYSREQKTRLRILTSNYVIILRTKFHMLGSRIMIIFYTECHVLHPRCVIIFAAYNQQEATFHDLFISVRRFTCFRRGFRPSSGTQNCTYSVRPLLLPAANLARLAAGSSNGLTLYVQFWAHDDGQKNCLKHVERLTEINKLRNVASCWLYAANTLVMHGHVNVKSLQLYQLMHLYKNFHTKTHKIASKCFDPKIIFREPYCSFLKSHFLKTLID